MVVIDQLHPLVLGRPGEDVAPGGPLRRVLRAVRVEPWAEAEPLDVAEGTVPRGVQAGWGRRERKTLAGKNAPMRSRPIERKHRKPLQIAISQNVGGRWAWLCRQVSRSRDIAILAHESPNCRKSLQLSPTINLRMRP